MNPRRSIENFEELAADPVVDRYMLQIGEGHRCITHIVQDAQALRDAGRSWPGNDFFADMGTTSLTNCERDLHDAVKRLYKFDLNTWNIKVRVKHSTKPDAIEEIDLPALAPYEIFAEMYKSPPQFHLSMLGPDSTSAPEQYWDLLRENGEAHPANDDPELAPFRASLVPLYWHEDAGEIYKNTPVRVFSVRSATVSDISSGDQQFFTTCIEEHVSIDETNDDLAKWIRWNEEVLESRVHPYKDMYGKKLTGRLAELAGTPLAGGWGATGAGYQGDLKEEVKTHRYTRNYHCNFLCPRCLGSRHLQDCNAYNFRDNAMWTHTIVSHKQHMATHKGNARSPFAICPWWTLYRNLPDILHGLWLGPGKDIAGQMIHDFAMLFFPDMPLKTALFWLGRRCRQWCKDEGMPIQKMQEWSEKTISMGASGATPTLAERIKGSLTKQIFFWVAAETQRIVTDGIDTSHYAKKRASCCWHLLRYVNITDQAGWRLSNDEAVAQLEHGWEFLKLYAELAADALRHEQLAYKVRPKLHYLWHTFMEAYKTRLNPRRYDLFAAEDFIGRIKRLGAQCHRSSLSQRVCDRLRIFYAHRWYKAANYSG